MSSVRFHARALKWLRDEKGFRTSVRPEQRLEEVSGGARVQGHFTRPSTAGGWAFAGLCALTLGSVLTMLNPPGLTEDARTGVQRTGNVAQAVGAGGFVAAEVIRRRNRTRALVELRSGTSRPVTSRAVASLCNASPGSTVWIIAEDSVPNGALTTAGRLGVRCFVASGKTFDEVHEDTPGAPEGKAVT